MITAVLLIAYTVSPAMAADIRDGMCSDLGQFSSDELKAKTEKDMINACVESLAQQVRVSGGGKYVSNTKPGGDIVWWKNGDAFVMARCKMVNGHMLVTMSSHTDARTTACSAMDTIWNLLGKLVSKF